MLTFTTTLTTRNHLTSFGVVDTFKLNTGPATFEGVAIEIGGFQVNFHDQDFFVGDGVPPLPVFSPADVDYVSRAQLYLVVEQDFYWMTDVTVSVVPEPGAALGVVLGLSALWRRPRDLGARRLRIVRSATHRPRR